MSEALEKTLGRAKTVWRNRDKRERCIEVVCRGKKVLQQKGQRAAAV